MTNNTKQESASLVARDDRFHPVKTDQYHWTTETQNYKRRNFQVRTHIP